MATKTTPIIADDVLTGISAVISVFVHGPQFSSQAKVKLGGREVYDCVYSALVREFNKFIRELSDEQRQAIATKIKNNAKIRSAAEIAKVAKKKSIVSKNPTNLPSHLKDCAEIGSDRSELYICEGQSAAGTVVAARSAKYQGCLGIRGKILNVMKLDFRNKKQLERFRQNAEIEDIIKALGVGIGDQCDIDKCRYGKVIFAADADIDGRAICMLLLGVFYKLFRPLIAAGRVYQCVSPLYEIHYKEDGKFKSQYAIDNPQRDVILKELKKKKITKYKIDYCKGLGECNADVFHDCVLNPKNRRLIRITMKDAERANEILNLAIGEGSADERKKWMLEHNQVIDDLNLYQ